MEAKLKSSSHSSFKKALQKFAQIRNMRMKAYPDMVRQELEVETIEGMAEYVGLKALQRINFKKFTGIINDYLCKLRQQDSLLFDVRRICYYSGALYDLCLEKYGMEIHNDFADERRSTSRILLLWTQVPLKSNTAILFLPDLRNLSGKEKSRFANPSKSGNIPLAMHLYVDMTRWICFALAVSFIVNILSAWM